MKRQAAPAATFLVLILFSLAATADVIYVDHTGGGDYLTIQEGVNAASEGDTVLVSCGTYYEHDIEIAPGICLISETGFADCVIVDAEALGRVLHCVGGANTTVTIVGFTLANGRVVIPGENTARGGGMFCEWSVSPTIVRCTFTGNYAQSYVAKGGGLFCNSSATITDCVFSNNATWSTQGLIWVVAPEGGGARIEGDATVSGCTFESNQAHVDCGGLYVEQGTITDCLFLNNGAGRDVGAFYSCCSSSFSSCVFSGNWSGGIAGAVWCCSSYPTDPVFTGCTFSGNSSEALRLETEHAEITNCTFVGNASPAIRESDSSPIIQRTIIAFTEGGPGLSCYGSGAPLISQCCIFGNAGGDSLCGDYHDNMFQNPLFCGAGSGDYTLHAESPCLPTNNPWGVLVGAHGQGCGPLTTWYVDCANSSGIEDGSEAYPFDTIREGIDAATEADTVLVAPGTYVGSENRDLDFGGINMTLRGTGGAESTTVDCEDQGRAFHFVSGEDSTSVIDGFTITNGYVSYALYEAPQGGGIYCNASSPILTDLVFIENAADSYGGGVYCTLGASPILRHVSFIGNSAYDGGGMDCRHDCFPVLMDVLFEGNSALSGGGFVAGENCGGHLTNVTFESNHADLWGGAASIGSGSSPVLTNVTFSHNDGRTGGGVSCTWSSNPVFVNVTFIGNHGVTGGGLYCLNSSPSLTQTIIAMSTSGSAVVCQGTSEPTITHSCIFGNAGGDGLCGNYYDNMFEDPLFCLGEATLHNNSPCLPENNEWGELIGAHGAGGCGVSPVDDCFFATATSSESVVLRWTIESLNGVEGFEIYRGTSQAGPFAKVNETPIPPALPGVYEDATVWPATTFWYELRTVLTGGSEEVVAGSAVSATTGGELLVALYPPRPNPFTDEVRVRFDVPGRGEPLSIGVYNVRGQLVKMLVRGSPSRGRHEVTWDGTGTHGLQVSSGVYLLRLHVGEHGSTRRILLVR